MKPRRSILRFALAASALALAGCGAVGSAFWQSIPTIITTIKMASDVISQIVSFVETKITNDALRKKVADAVAKARAALDAVTSAIAGANDIHDQKLQDAIAAFRQAYDDLLALVASLGVHAKGAPDMLGAGVGETLEVPASKDFEFEVRK